MPRRKVFGRKLLTKRSARLAGLPELIDKFNSLGKLVEADEIYPILMQGAKVLRDKAKDLAPYDPKRRRGVHLRDAIFAAEGDPSKDPRGPNVIAGVNRRKAPHAHLVERGTAKMAARPFWRPAITAARPAVASIYASGLKRLIADAVAKASGTSVTVGGQQFGVSNPLFTSKPVLS